MAKSAADLDRILAKVLDELKAALGEDLEAVALYGSAADGEFMPGLSDINLMVILSPAGLTSLNRLAPLANSWLKKRVAPPLTLSREELERSLDTFPLEFLNIKLRHKMLFGPDVLAEVEIDSGDLRLQCEREIKGKLFLLRKAMLQTGGRERDLKQTALDSIKAFTAIFRGVLHLLGDDPAGLTAAQVLDRASVRLGLSDRDVFGLVWKLRQMKKKPARGEVIKLFGRYLAAVAEAADKIDAWTPGDNDENA